MKDDKPQVEMISAYCECCDNEDFGTRERLERKGWELNSNSQFCPEHAD